MDMNEYQMQAGKTAIYPDAHIGSIKGISYTGIGLAEEAGEVAGHIKRILRDDEQQLTDERKVAILKELGDVLWYVSQLASELNTPLSVVASFNIAKLKERKETGKLQGEGSDR